MNTRFVPRTRDEQRALSRAIICASAKQLFLTKGFDHVSVEEIAKAAKVTRSTFYLYFKSKEDVLGEVLTEILHDHLNHYVALVETPVLDFAAIRAWLADYRTSYRIGRDATHLLREIARLNPDERQVMILAHRMRVLAVLGRRFEPLRLGGDAGADARKRALAHLLIVQLEGVVAFFSTIEGAPDAGVGLDIVAEQFAAMAQR
jgi:AcrR family transcriptional regulator